MADEATPDGSKTATGGTAFKFDVGKWTMTDKRVAIATLVFFISLFLPWFGVGYGLYHGSVDGLYHGYMYLALIVAIVILADLLMRAGLDKMPMELPITHDQLLLFGTGINFVLALISFLLAPAGTSREWGAYVGIIAAFVAVAPFLIPALRQRMGKKSA